MNESFCFWDFNEWKTNLEDAGFKIHPDSKIFTNEWIVQKRWLGKASLFTHVNNELQPLPYPPTTMFLIGIKSFQLIAIS